MLIIFNKYKLGTIKYDLLCEILKIRMGGLNDKYAKLG